MHTLDVTFPSGETRTVHLLRMLVQTQNAEFKRDHGMFLPGIGKQHPTVKALADEYELSWFADQPVKTWSLAADAMRHVYNTFMEHIDNA